MELKPITVVFPREDANLLRVVAAELGSNTSEIVRLFCKWGAGMWASAKLSDDPEAARGKWLVEIAELNRRFGPEVEAELKREGRRRR